MTQLEKLYQSIQNLKELGVKLPDKLIGETNRIEEEIIKNDIIPALEMTISPVISQIQRELVLVVEYVPDEPLSVKLTRKRSMTIPSDQDVVDGNKRGRRDGRTFTVPSHTKSAKTGLLVKFPNGKVISQRYAYQTLVDAIISIGVDKVKQLNIYCAGVPLISDKKDDFYRQYEVSNGQYIMTHSATQLKKQQLDEISRYLNLGLEVEII